MRVVFFSTYPPIQCGIATYTRWLAGAVAALGAEVFVIAPSGAIGPHVFPILRIERPDWVRDAVDAAVALRPEVVHLQHEFGLYGNGPEAVDLVRGLLEHGVPVVATLHSVPSDPTPWEQSLLQQLARHCSRLIVHEDEQRGRLGPERVEVVEHGVRLVAPIPGAKAKMDIKGNRVVLASGYLRPRKCFHSLVEWFPAIARRVPDAELVIAGGVSSFLPAPHFSAYRERLRRQIAESPCADRIRFLEGSLPQEQFDALFCAADVVALPYQRVTQSGVLAHCYAFARPVVASDLPAFRASLERSGAGMVAGTPEAFVDSVVRLLQDDCLRQRCEASAARFVRERASWPLVAARHLEIYQLG